MTLPQGFASEVLGRPTAEHWALHLCGCCRAIHNDNGLVSDEGRRQPVGWGRRH